MFGLTAEPDINHFEIQPDDKVVLLASDGLWDVIDPITACELGKPVHLPALNEVFYWFLKWFLWFYSFVALNARANGRCATQEIAEKAVREMPEKCVSDNVSVIAIFLN